VRRRPPVITAFASSVDPLRDGRIVLKWQTDDATTVRLEPGPGRVPSSGSVIVDLPPPGESVTYRLIAGNPDHPTVERDLTLTAARRVVVARSPVRTPEPLRTGGPSPRRTPRTSLTRRPPVTPAPRVTAAPATAQVTPQVSVPVTPQPQATPEPPVAAASVEVSLAKTTLALGDSTQLCWIAFNALSGRIDPDIGDLPPAEVEKGCRTVSPRQTTTYTITVAGRDRRSVKKQITIEVQVLEVQILAFSARKTFLAPGEATEICWSVANARSVRLDPDFGELPRGEIDRGCRDIAPRTTTTYFLIVTGRDGKTVTRTLVVAVRLR
jgi:hypothetical protein